MESRSCIANRSRGRACTVRSLHRVAVVCRSFGWRGRSAAHLCVCSLSCLCLHVCLFTLTHALSADVDMLTYCR